MNLYFRMLWIILKAFRRPMVRLDDLKNNVCVRIYPNDLDVNLHVNNGRYLTLCDLNRVDFFVRSGLASVMKKNKWSPVIAEHSMTYIKPVNLFDVVNIYSEIKHWDDKFIYSDHWFERKGKVVAKGQSKALVVSKEGSVPTAKVFEAVEEYQATRLALS
jgi:YbgC/YbaW family acyl-CoA thioester hydrolase